MRTRRKLKMRRFMRTILTYILVIVIALTTCFIADYLQCEHAVKVYALEENEDY